METFAVVDFALAAAIVDPEAWLAGIHGVNSART
jgi:hypothetical protein